MKDTLIGYAAGLLTAVFAVMIVWYTTDISPMRAYATTYAVDLAKKETKQGINKLKEWNDKRKSY